MATPRATAPLTLEHDITPKDFDDVNHTDEPTRQVNFRFKGYPDTSFATGRIPILGSVPGRSVHIAPRYGRTQHFIRDPNTGYTYFGRNIAVGSAPSRLGYADHTNVATNNRESHSSQPISGTDQGVLYSSEAVPFNKQTPTPKKTLFISDRLSAEERKRAFQKQEADDDIANFKEQRKQHQIEHLEEQRKDLALLQTYQPFGRPGGGAPQDIRKRTRQIETMKIDGKTDETSSVDPDKLEFGKPGAGAPIRTDSGNIQTNIRSDQEIHFQGGKAGLKTINNHKRYTQEAQTARRYYEDLENISLEQRTKREIEKYNDKLTERNTLEYNPFGRPGAGAPIKTDSGRLKANLQMTLTNDCLEQRNLIYKHQPHVIQPTKSSPPQLREVEKSITWEVDPITGNNGYHDSSSEERSPVMEADQQHKKESKYDPWGKGFGVPDRDHNGNIKRYKFGDNLGVREDANADTVGGSLEMRPYGGGGHHIDEKGEKVTRMKITMEQAKTGGNLRGILRASEPLTKEFLVPGSGEYNPWGRPGHGAPIKTESGKLVAATAGAITSDINSPYNPVRQQAKQQYLQELKREMHLQQETRHKEEQELMTNSGEEAASWIRHGQIGYPKKDPVTGIIQPHHKQTSDVVSQRLDIRRDHYPNYHTDLERQAYERSRLLAADKKQSANLTEKHQVTMDHMWGKPGAGAPNSLDHRKQPLELEKVADPQPSESLYPSWIRTDIGKPGNKPWVKTKSLDRRFHSPKEMLGTQVGPF